MQWDAPATDNKHAACVPSCAASFVLVAARIKKEDDHYYSNVSKEDRVPTLVRIPRPKQEAAAPQVLTQDPGHES